MTFNRALRRRGVAGPLDDGVVTAETAIVMPAIVLLMTAVLGGIGWSSQFVQCQQAAGDIARAVVRGESDAHVHALSERLTPSGAAVTITRGDREVVVTITADSAIASPLLRPLPDISVSATVPHVP